MDNKFRYIIIDGQNLFWRCFSVSLKKYFIIKDHDLFPGAIRESITRVDHIKNIFGYDNTEIYFCFDNPNSIIDMRKVIDENYKSHRFKKNAPKGLYQTLAIFIEILKYFSDNYRVVNVDNLEADDLTKPIINTLELTNRKKCVVISNDLDWARNMALSEYICWWNYHKLYDQTAFREEFKFPAKYEKIQLYKSIHGDTSDNIENAVPYLPKDLLIRIVNEFDNVDDLYNGLFKTDYPQQWKVKLKESERDVRKNLCLVDFALVDFDISNHIVECRQNVDALRFFYDALELRYESFMEKGKNIFLQKKKYKRI